jgi:hypothetical protein
MGGHPPYSAAGKTDRPDNFRSVRIRSFCVFGVLLKRPIGRHTFVFIRVICGLFFSEISAVNGVKKLKDGRVSVPTFSYPWCSFLSVSSVFYSSVVLRCNGRSTTAPTFFYPWCSFLSVSSVFYSSVVLRCNGRSTTAPTFFYPWRSFLSVSSVFYSSVVLRCNGRSPAI